ncbi:MAG: RNA methyltransferase [Actinomycetales bacterium]|nr:MAG: RNA methyltransferase [Actinomycetales bacterium]
MLSNPRAERVRRVRALAQRSTRRRVGLFLAEGPPAVAEAVRWRPELVRDLYATAEAASRHTTLLDDATGADVSVRECTPEVLAAMSDTRAPQGLLAVCRAQPGVLPATLDTVLAARPRLLCVLTHVRDPGNAGTVIRAADAAGADAVVLSSESVDVLAPKAVRATAGSLFHLPIVVGEHLDTLFDQLAGHRIRVLSADGSGSVLLPDARLDSPHAWVFGNEAWGTPEQLRDRCDQVVRVPIHGRAESLNLAMAATVCLYASAAAQRDQPWGGQ